MAPLQSQGFSQHQITKGNKSKAKAKGVSSHQKGRAVNIFMLNWYRQQRAVVSKISHWFPRWWWERNIFNTIKRRLELSWRAFIFFFFPVTRLLKIWKIKQNFIAVAKWKFSKDYTKIYFLACCQRGVKACGTAVIFNRALLYFLACLRA